MDLKTQRRLASEILGVGENRVWMDPQQLKEISGAITKDDVRRFIAKGVINAKIIVGESSARAKYTREQKKKGRRRGPGKRRGALTARNPEKQAWMKRIRALRSELSALREKKKITPAQYAKLYKMAGAGIFRDRANLRLQVSKLKESESLSKEAKSESK